MAHSSCLLLLAFLASLSLIKDAHLFFCNGDRTDGFTSVPLQEWNFEMEKPYDTPLGDRYGSVDGVRRMWVYSTDKPLQPTSGTKPRTELRIRGYDYDSSVWQFEGYGFVPNGTTGTSIMQLESRSGGLDSVLMMKVYDGQLKFYSRTVVESNVYDRWMRVNMIHDVENNKVAVFIDGVQKLEVGGNGRSTFHFKCGVYTQTDPSHYMESRWRNIKVLKKY